MIPAKFANSCPDGVGLQVLFDQINLEDTVMKISTLRSWLGAAAIGLAAVLPVQAGVVTFDDVEPGLAIFGESLSSGGFTFTDDNFGGFITIDNAGTLFAPPANPDGQFLGMFNNAGVVMTATDGSGFFLNSFDAAFLGVLPLQAGFLGGELTVVLQHLMGGLSTETFSFAPGDFGADYPFTNFALDASRGTALSAAYFSSCAYQEDGTCSFDGLLPAQFALDNLAVPEPGSAVLVATALGLLLIRRRKATVA